MSRLLLIALLPTIFFGCSHSQRVQVSASAIPFTQQLRMQKGDAYEFQLPNGKLVAVWCEQPGIDMMLMLGEQTTKSGLKTAWGDRAFNQRKSYIVQGSVVTSDDLTSEYELFVGDLRFAIIEDLRATDALPVTIKITRK